MSSHGAVATAALATAMAFSGTVILIAVCRHKSLSTTTTTLAYAAPASPRCHLRPCIPSEGRKRERENMREKKRVHFSDQVVEFDHDGCNDEEVMMVSSEDDRMVTASQKLVRTGGGRNGVRPKCRMPMPANRLALYKGILQDRMQRMAFY